MGESERDDSSGSAPNPPALAPAAAPVPASASDLTSATSATSAASATSATWRALPPAAATTAMFAGAFTGLVLGIAPTFGAAIPLAARALGWPWWQSMALAATVWLAAGMLGTFFAYRRWRSSAWKLDETGLRFRRGWLWQREVLVPRTRVQHLDIERGPIERHYGLATLVVHTAGTRHHALRIAGLADDEAVALRDALVPASALHDDVL
jgi:membrane protein YdbS with pleckstrin-like domain